MWRVTAKGAESGTEYVFQVDAPDNAPESAVWDAACRQHGKENQGRTRVTRESLDIRTGAYRVEFVRPQGTAPADKEEIIRRAAEVGLTLEASDLVPDGNGFRIDGMDADDWLAAL